MLTVHHLSKRFLFCLYAHAEGTYLRDLNRCKRNAPSSMWDQNAGPHNLNQTSLRLPPSHNQKHQMGRSPCANKTFASFITLS